MDDDETTSAARWTCEACGCITNSRQDNPSSCSVCASARQIPDTLRRDEPLSSQLLRRSFFMGAVGGGIDFQRSFHPRNLDDIESDMMDDDDEEHVAAALALEVAGVADASRIPSSVRRRELLLRSAADTLGFGMDSVAGPTPSPDELLEMATENASYYIPQWETPMNLGIRRKGNALLVGDNEYANVAMLPIGATEGKSIRTHEPIPRVNEAQTRRRKVFGFRVTFKRPFREKGKSLGGGYLIGVTTSSFTSFDERNSLQQSSIFWGIDDNCHKYEPGAGPIRGARRSHHGLEMSSRQVPRTTENVFYGCLEVVTVVIDSESGTLTFWRDDQSLGTIVRCIPRSMALYPVVVPFNAGAVVAITGLDGNPAICLERYETHVKEVAFARDKAKRQNLWEQRSRLVCEGNPTELLKNVLKQVFALYVAESTDDQLDIISASRLWYRACLKLTNLTQKVENKAAAEGRLFCDVGIVFDDFLDVLRSLIKEDEVFYNQLREQYVEGKSNNADRDVFQVGDIVELMEGYERFGDAARGPMVPGDRGQVVEVQQGPSGERHSIRVLFNGRRWWYQPQTLLTEKSGLIATPAVWFIQRILRAHGFDHISLTPNWGKQVTSSSWLVGDIVVPALDVKSPECLNSSSTRAMAKVNASTVGRIVPPSVMSGSHGVSQDRDSGFVCVEFVDSLFAVRVGLSDSGSDDSSRVHRVNVKSLVHAGMSQVLHETKDHYHTDSMKAVDVSSPSLPGDLKSLSSLDLQGIESVSKECQKSQVSLARVFASGLPSATYEAINATRLAALSDRDEAELLPVISALGNLLLITAKHLFQPEKKVKEGKTAEPPANEVLETNQPGPGLQGDVRNTQSSHASLYGDSFGLFRSNNEHTEHVLLRQQIAARRTMTRRVWDRVDVSPFGHYAQSASWGRPTRQGISNTSTSDSLATMEGSLQQLGALNLKSPLLNSTRKGGFEVLLPGEDARRGAPVLNAATKSAIVNGLLANNFVWLQKVVETAKRRKGSSSMTSSLVNARDEDSMPLLVLAISLGCSTSIVSYLIRNGATVDDEVITKAAYLGQKDILSHLLMEHVFCEGMVDKNVCSKEIMMTFENARKRQKYQQDSLSREGEEFLANSVLTLMKSALQCRCLLAPRVRIYRSILEVLVGRVLLRAMHFTRIEGSSDVTSGHLSSKPKSPSDGESGRVNVFAPDEVHTTRRDSAPSAIAASEGLLFIIPTDTLSSKVFKHNGDLSGGSFSDICGLVESLMWTKDVEDVALGLTLTSILLRSAPLLDCAVSIRRFGIADLVSLHERDADKRLANLADKSGLATFDSTRFSTEHVASKAQEVTLLLSNGVVLCTKCHFAELHLTRHSQFRCDLCGKGVDRGYPMHGCRECDWDACEECIGKCEGAIVKWKHVQNLSRECLNLLADRKQQLSNESVEAEVSAKDWSTKVLSARIKGMDCDALKEFSSRLRTPWNLTMFEFSNYFLPVLHQSFCGEVSNDLPPTDIDSPPKKKHRSHFLPDFGNVADRREFLIKAIDLFVREPITESLEGVHLDEVIVEEMGDKKSSSEDVSNPSGDESLVQSGQAIGESSSRLLRHAPELFRRLHEVISFCEHFSDSKSKMQWLGQTSSELQSLIKPWIIEVSPPNGKVFALHVEPLTRLVDLQNQILRSTACADPSYDSYCQSLADDRSIIAESPHRVGLPSASDSEAFQLAQIVSYDSESGCHTIKYASRLLGNLNEESVLDPSSMTITECLAFDGAEKHILLVSRQYFVLQRYRNARRSEYKSIVQNVLKSQDMLDDSISSYPEDALPKGTRVERHLSHPKDSVHYTIIGCSEAEFGSSDTHREFIYDLVSDDGIVSRRVPQREISTGIDNDRISSSAHLTRARGSSRDLSSRMLALRGLTVGGDDDSDHATIASAGVLKRSWSALSPLSELAPVDLNATGKNEKGTRTFEMRCLLGESLITVDISSSNFEHPPQLHVGFALDKCQPLVDLRPSSRTLTSALWYLLERNRDKSVAVQLSSNIRLYVGTVFDHDKPHRRGGRPNFSSVSILSGSSTYTSNNPIEENVSLSFGSIPPLLTGMDESMKEVEVTRTWSDESEKLTLMCLQLIDLIGRHVHEGGMCVEVGEDSGSRSSLLEIIDAALESRTLTRKLTEQLDQTLEVVSGALPSWCTEVPSLVPRLFNYAARRRLLERSAYGVSRATMRLQEAKVNVGALRQRMAALRGRAVELVGEAFSGGAEDPTALQLQADELYGMEEALGTRVAAAFRAQRWQERALQCAKAAVRRNKLLSDAAKVMERYTRDKLIRQRRLEIRFVGESGFDAASGDEAGVTRGFYADVAEALLSCQHVSISTCDPLCAPQTSIGSTEVERLFVGKDLHLPLWIPDLDSSRKTIIPTPRACGQSTPGVYPRPLSLRDPRMQAIKDQFQFMGRMFACAMRDELMFPLPLSCSFLRLVQCCSINEREFSAQVDYAVAMGQKASLKQLSRPSSPCLDDGEYSYEENTPTTGAKLVGDVCRIAGGGLACGMRSNLDSLDLPRPGFLGGEVFAVELHVCKHLDAIDVLRLGEDETKKRYLQIASNKDFVRNAFGKTYDYSFEEYFEGRSFVDPLDPSQGPGATPLCPEGHTREVTIFNIREWVELAKSFILKDGVLEQAMSFQRGVSDVFPSEYLRIFTPAELQRDVCGGSDRVETWTEEDVQNLFKLDGAKGATEALVAVAAIGGEGGATLSRRFGSSSPTIAYLIKTLLKSTTTQRRQFLNFVTSVPIVTPGKIEVVPIVSPSGDFLSMSDNCLPRANTCARRLYLPKFESFETFSSILWSVIREESKFKGFYEWRGN